MSTSADVHTNGDSHEHILRPRAVKPPNPAVIRTISEEGLQPTIAITDVSEEGSVTDLTRCASLSSRLQKSN